ncbi:FecR family protein [Pararobbsia silviterrae]|uniref:FecR family protein n=2 Tax=Pararobbsia silviterrae TaxID=1792498 RepID=A0A494XGA0_9BURK|nr:FecR family protein [Pararobbsia silviterrae]
MQAGGFSEADQAALDAWRTRSPEHAQAWDRAQRVLDMFANVPAPIGSVAIRQLPSGRRRTVVRGLGMVALMAPTAWLVGRTAAWRDWNADIRTATGERKTVTLADGTQLVLNTRSAVDVRFSSTERRLRLIEGELLATTGPDTQAARYRPFIVETPQGDAQALGTRYTVRLIGEHARVSVFEGRVAVRPLDGGAQRVIDTGMQADFSSTAVSAPHPASASAALWERGMYVANDQRLADVLDELSRYRAGAIHCASSVANLRVSGAFPIDDTDASLDLLAKTLPIKITSLTHYWQFVDAR